MNETEILSTLKLYSTKYIDEVINYFELTKKSNAMINDTHKKLTQIGYRTITHIFQTNLIRTGDIYIAHFSMQKGYLYYLEYLEQTEMSDVNNNLNEQSAILFIYDKTILKNALDNYVPNKIDNLILLTVPRITKLIDTILWFDNNNIEQNKIEFNIVKSICELLNNSSDNLITTYVEFGQKRTMTTFEYNTFLERALKIFRENSTHKKYSENDWKEQMLKKFAHIDEAKNFEILKWCKWLWI
jgi:hypothetical protein